MPQTIHGPTSHYYISQRLKLHYVDWGNFEAPPLVLVHGGRDHCRNWDWVAQVLREDYHIIAPDLRGHGDSQWMMGGAYLLVDYVYDLAQLIHQTGMAPVKILAHSLGGMISLRYAGLYPNKVSRVAAIEGLGSPPEREAKEMARPVHERLGEWVDRLRKVSGRQPRRYASIEEAYQRMQAENTHLSPVQARHLTVHGVNQNEDGSYSWKFDNYVRIFPPHNMGGAETHGLWSRIDCPTMLIRGTESWASDPLVDGRAEAFQNATCINIENAGHWVHHDRLEEFLDLVRDFLAE